MAYFSYVDTTLRVIYMKSDSNAPNHVAYVELLEKIFTFKFL